MGAITGLTLILALNGTALTADPSVSSQPTQLGHKVASAKHAPASVHPEPQPIIPSATQDTLSEPPLPRVPPAPRAPLPLQTDLLPLTLPRR